MGKSWYAFLGGEISDPLSYYKITVKHGCLCGFQLCAIYANDNGVHPKVPFSDNLTIYISNALTSGQLQPEFPFGNKKYVYLKL